MKKTAPVALGILVGLYAVAEYFIPHGAVRELSAHVFEWGGIIAAAAYVIGGINVVQVTWPKIRRREPDWGFKIVLLASAAIMMLVGLPWRGLGPPEPSKASVQPAIDPALAARHKAAILVETPDDVAVTIGATVTTSAATPRVEVEPGKLHLKASRRVVGYEAYDELLDVAPGQVVELRVDPPMKWGADGRARTWIYDHVFAPCNATMFALLAFFVASAAFRAFRARNLESALLLGSAIIILLARAPIGRAISASLPDLAQWILDIPSNGSRRAIIMGAAVGAIATGLRVILGLERSHLGGDS